MADTLTSNMHKILQGPALLRVLPRSNASLSQMAYIYTRDILEVLNDPALLRVCFPPPPPPPPVPFPSSPQPVPPALPPRIRSRCLGLQPAGAYPG